MFVFFSMSCHAVIAFKLCFLNYWKFLSPPPESSSTQFFFYCNSNFISWNLSHVHSHTHTTKHFSMKNWAKCYDMELSCIVYSHLKKNFSHQSISIFGGGHSVTVLHCDVNMHQLKYEGIIRGKIRTNIWTNIKTINLTYPQC